VDLGPPKLKTDAINGAHPWKFFGDASKLKHVRFIHQNSLSFL
jgi:hypothetical protein